MPPANIAVGTGAVGPGAWVPADSIVRVGTGAPAGDLAAAAARALAAAAGRSLVMVVRDAHRYPAAQALVTMLLAARPDAVVVEMGLRLWRPRGGGYVASLRGGAGAAAGGRGGPRPRPPAGRDSTRRPAGLPAGPPRGDGSRPTYGFRPERRPCALRAVSRR